MFSIAGMGIFLVLLFLSRKEEESKKRHLFKGMAMYLYKKYRIYCMQRRKNSMSIKTDCGGITNELNILYPNMSREQLQTRHYTEKAALALTVLFVGNILSMFLWISESLETSLVDEGIVKRGSFGESSAERKVTVYREDGYRTDRILTVEAMQYSEQELEKLYISMLPELRKTVLADNDENCVTKPLNLINKVEGYPFAITWTSADQDVLRIDGSFGSREIDSLGEELTVTADIRFGAFQEEYCLWLRMYPPEQTANERWENSLDRRLSEGDEESIYEINWELPLEIEGQAVRWEEERETLSTGIWILGITASLGVFFLKDKDIHTQILKRQEVLMEEYAVIVSKLVLFIGAGLSVRAAWEKIACEYKNRKDMENNPAYREMLYTSHEIKSGTSEAVAYERFGRRSRLQPYIKLTTLLSQNLKKGNSALLIQLREEADYALEEKKNNTRKKGEEISTKMLLPMMLLLVMVMIWIMMPAVSMFR